MKNPFFSSNIEGQRIVLILLCKSHPSKSFHNLLEGGAQKCKSPVVGQSSVGLDCQFLIQKGFTAQILHHIPIPELSKTSYKCLLDGTYSCSRD